MVTISVTKGIKQHTPKIIQTKSLHDRLNNKNRDAIKPDK